MSSLLALLSSGKGSWTHVQQLIKNEKWEHVYIVTNEFGKQNFTPPNNATLITVNFQQPITQLRDELTKHFKEKLSGDIGLSIISGNGEEHMAVLSALLKSGAGIRLVIPTTNGVEEL